MKDANYIKNLIEDIEQKRDDVWMITTNEKLLDKMFSYYDTIIECLGKQVPKTPIDKDERYDGIYHCPICNKLVVYDVQYCPDCGQRLDWNFDDESKK